MLRKLPWQPLAVGSLLVALIAGWFTYTRSRN